MATIIYGLDWYEGDGLDYAYTELADAKLDVLEYLCNRFIEDMTNRACLDIGTLEEDADVLALDAESLVVDEYVDDIVNIVYLNLNDKFKPTPATDGFYA